MTLAENIITVLTTRFKKDAKEAFKDVEHFFKVFKYDTGVYGIESNTTHRRIVLRSRERWMYVESLKHSTYVTVYRLYIDGYAKGEFTAERLHKVNFIKLLNTPLNTAWKELNRASTRPTVDKFSSLRWAKQSVKYSEERLVKIQNQIADLQKSLIREAEYLADKKQEVKTERNKLGLRYK